MYYEDWILDGTRNYARCRWLKGNILMDWCLGGSSFRWNGETHLQGDAAVACSRGAFFANWRVENPFLQDWARAPSLNHAWTPKKLEVSALLIPYFRQYQPTGEFSWRSEPRFPESYIVILSTTTHCIFQHLTSHIGYIPSVVDISTLTCILEVIFKSLDLSVTGYLF